MNTFFVTGGTGLVGYTVISKLRNSDFNVIALVRKNSPQNVINELLEKGVKLVYGDLLDPSSYEYYLSTADVVIHTAALVRSTNHDDYYKINSEGTRILLTVMRNYSVLRLIYMSTAGVYGPIYKKNILETERLNPISPYEKSKFQSEQIIINEFNDIKATIIRSPFIIGDASKDRHILPRLGKFTYRNLSVRVWRYNSKIGFAHSEDLASAIILLSCSEVERTEIYNIQSFQITIKELLSIITHTDHGRVFFIPVPYLILGFMASIVDFYKKKKGRQTYLRKNLKKLKYDWTLSSAKIKSEFDWTPIHTDFKELEILLDEYLQIIH